MKKELLFTTRKRKTNGYQSWISFSVLLVLSVFTTYAFQPVPGSTSISYEDGSTDVSICVDDTEDVVTVVLENEFDTENVVYIITDDEPRDVIVKTMESPTVDLNMFGPGRCKIWALGYDGTIDFDSFSNRQLEEFLSLNPDVVISENFVYARRNQPVGGTLSGGPFEFDVDDTSDFVSGLQLEGWGGNRQQWVVTDEDGIILGLPGDIESVDFNEAGPGTCLIWHLSYFGELVGAEVGANATEIEGCWALSTPVTVIRNSSVGQGSGDFGPDQNMDISICLDDEADVVTFNVPDFGTDNSGIIITDEDSVDAIVKIMDGATIDLNMFSPGRCKVFGFGYNDDDNVDLDNIVKYTPLEEFKAANPGAVVTGNFVTIRRNKPEGGTLSGGPYEFDVDEDSDFVTDAQLEGAVGANQQWVVTDADGTILGLPGDIANVDFNEAGPGTCLIWNLSYYGEISGAEVGALATSIEGCWALSNPLTVIRNSSVGQGSGDFGPDQNMDISICLDDEADVVTFNVPDFGTDNSGIIITDEDSVDAIVKIMDGATIDLNMFSPGRCKVFGFGYNDDDNVDLDNIVKYTPLEEFKAANPGAVVTGNFVTIRRNKPEGGTLTGGPYLFEIDGEADFVTDVQLEGAVGANQQWVVTDLNAQILGLPGDIADVDFDQAGIGACLIWNLAYYGDLEGAEVGALATDIQGCFALSNPLRVDRISDEGMFVFNEDQTNDMTICIDDEPDVITLDVPGDIARDNVAFLLTDAGDLRNIVKTMASNTFDANMFGAGRCRIYAIGYDDADNIDLDNVTGGTYKPLDEFLAENPNVMVSENYVKLLRVQPVGGTLEGGPYEITVDGESDFITDLSLTGAGSGTNQWVVTDADGVILGLPGDIAQVDFDAAGPGTCLIWNLNYYGELSGAELQANAADLSGCFALSNPIEVVRIGAPDNPNGEDNGDDNNDGQGEDTNGGDTDNGDDGETADGQGEDTQGENLNVVVFDGEDELFIAAPNPASDVLNLAINTLNLNPKDIRISIVNFAGVRYIANATFDKATNTLSVDISNIPTGNYLVQLENLANGSETVKRIVIK